jgi:hypothetical protein
LQNLLFLHAALTTSSAPYCCDASSHLYAGSFSLTETKFATGKSVAEDMVGYLAVLHWVTVNVVGLSISRTFPRSLF